MVVEVFEVVEVLEVLEILEVAEVVVEALEALVTEGLEVDYLRSQPVQDQRLLYFQVQQWLLLLLMLPNHCLRLHQLQ